MKRMGAAFLSGCALCFALLGNHTRFKHGGERQAPRRLNLPPPIESSPAARLLPPPPSTQTAPSAEIPQQADAEPRYEALELAALIWDFRTERKNLFFDRAAFAKSALERDSDLITHLTQFLSDIPIAAAQSEDLRTTRPEALLDRIAAIDLLEDAAKLHPLADGARAQGALAHLAAADWDRKLPEATQRAIVAEKYDAVTSLTRVAPQRAISMWQSIAPPLRAVLRPAIVGGLIDRGVERSAIESELAL